MLSRELFYIRIDRRLEQYKNFPDCPAVRKSIIAEVNDELEEIIKDEKENI